MIKISITLEQAAKWLAVTNLGGPFTKTERHLWRPKTATELDDLFEQEKGIGEGMDEACEDEYISFLKQLKGKKKKFLIEDLEKEGLIVALPAKNR